MMDMTLDDYIEKLLKIKEQFGGDVLIVQEDDNYELNGNITALSKYKVLRVRNMKKEQRRFVDSFDGTRYYCNVYITSNEDDKDSIKVLEI